MTFSQRLFLGFVAAVLSVLLFHQGFIGYMYGAGIIPNPPYSMRPVAPLGVPQLFSLAFWGGLWGALLLAVEPAITKRPTRYVLAFLFGGLIASSVGWFIVAPIKGLPMAAGWSAAGLARGFLINGVFGLGTLIIADVWRHYWPIEQR